MGENGSNIPKRAIRWQGMQHCKGKCPWANAQGKCPEEMPRANAQFFFLICSIVALSFSFIMSTKPRGPLETESAL